MFGLEHAGTSLVFINICLPRRHYQEFSETGILPVFANVSGDVNGPWYGTSPRIFGLWTKSHFDQESRRIMIS